MDVLSVIKLVHNLAGLVVGVPVVIYMGRKVRALTDEVKEIKRPVGEWELLPGDFDPLEQRHFCSNCHFQARSYPTRFCPNCGAEMRMGADTNEPGWEGGE